MLESFKKWWYRNRDTAIDRTLALESLAPLLLDSNAFSSIIQNGYAVVPFLDVKELQPLQSNLLTFDQKRSQSKGFFYTSGRDIPEARAVAKQLSWPLVKDFIPRIVNPNVAHVEGCAWLIKPPGEQGGLSPHQDSSLIDETRFASLYGWMPLQDVNKQNGTMHVIPGSHLWGIHFRSLDVSWPLQGHTELLMKHSVPINMKGGQMLLFEGALIHGSYINQTNEIRAALNFFFKPREAPMLHFMKDAQTPPGTVEAFEIDVDFFHQHDFRKRPDTSVYPFHQLYNHVEGVWSERRILRTQKRFTPKG